MDLNDSHIEAIKELEAILSPSIVKFDILTVRRTTLVKLKEVIDALLDSNNRSGRLRKTFEFIERIFLDATEYLIDCAEYYKYGTTGAGTNKPDQLGSDFERNSESRN
jgi:hypothetical protein